MGWKGESRRHSLSRKGIKTADSSHNSIQIRKLYAQGRSNSIPFFSSCVGWHREYIASLEYITDFGDKISYDEFLNNVEIDSELETQFENDAVAHFSKIPDFDIYVGQSNGVEYVFADYDDIVKLDKVALKEGYGTTYAWSREMYGLE